MTMQWLHNLSVLKISTMTSWWLHQKVPLLLQFGDHNYQAVLETPVGNDVMQESMNVYMIPIWTACFEIHSSLAPWKDYFPENSAISSVLINFVHQDISELFTLIITLVLTILIKQQKNYEWSSCQLYIIIISRVGCNTLMQSNEFFW